MGHLGVAPRRAELHDSSLAAVGLDGMSGQHVPEMQEMNPRPPVVPSEVFGVGARRVQSYRT